MAGSTVVVPFRKKLLEGEYQFPVKVPREFVKDREFAFSHFVLQPDLYSRKISQLEMDVAIDDLAEQHFPMWIMLKLKPSVDDQVFPTRHAVVKPRDVAQLVRSVNLFFESTIRPDYLHSFFWFDWIDGRLGTTHMISQLAWIEEQHSKEFFGTEVHKPSVTRLLFPTRFRPCILLLSIPTRCRPRRAPLNI